MVDLSPVTLERRLASGRAERFEVAGARRLVAAWSAADTARVALRATFASGAEAAFVLATCARGARRSHSSAAACADLAVDELRAREPLASITLESDRPLGTVTIAASRTTAAPPPTPLRAGAPAGAPAVALAVEPRSQYGPAPERGTPAFRAGARGWCAPASLAILLAAAGRALATDEVAAAVFDEAYAGTGNWSFLAGFAARYGFGAVAYLRDLAHARRFVEAGYPLALSFSWPPGGLAGAPLAQSAGHLAVLCGFDDRGDPRFADPAQPAGLAVYDYACFERVWLAHGGVAILAGAAGSAARMLALANGGVPSCGA